jgi:adenine-specific DNA-methyltransferase
MVRMECVDNLSFMKPLPDGSMNLIITSPPYNLGKQYERRTTMDEYVADQARVISECARLLHRRGSICWQVGNHVNDGEIYPLDIAIYGVFKALGLKLRKRIV